MEIEKFAWWPTKVTSGKRVWLKNYWHHTYRYDPSTGLPPIFSQTFEWTETVQEKTWRLLKYGAVDTRNIWNDPFLPQQSAQTLYKDKI